jgi:hypothetical protein
MTMKRQKDDRKFRCGVVAVAALLTWSIWAVPGRAEAAEAELTASPAAPGDQAEATQAAEPVPLSSVPRTQAPTGRRDPFRLPGPPVPGAPREGLLGPLPPGKRGLVISQIRLEGVVRLDNTGEMIAVVDTHLNRAFFLRENDQLYNGVVARITPDAVYFRENILDSQGRVTTREVVRRLGQGAGEER